MVYSALCKCDTLMPCPMLMHQNLYIVVALLYGDASP